MIYAITAACVLLAAGTVLWYRRRTRQLMKSLDRMLDVAMQGSFTEDSFDETMLSALESKLAHYLAASTVSARQVQAEKGMEITLEPTQACAVFDPRWTEEAVYNLLDNAVKYTPEGGAVRVRVTEYPLFAAIHVSDTGAGIPEEEQAKVFQRFYRGEAHREEEGVGIGLYLVRQIAQGQGGYVKVSARPGAGSTFSLYLPGR